MESRVCIVCGQEFIPSPRQNGASTCPPGPEDRLRAKPGSQPRSRCQKAHGNAKRRGTLDQLLARGKRPGAPFDCAQCGEHCIPGENVAPHATKFCGSECKLEWHRKPRAPHRPRCRVRKVQQRLWFAGSCIECGESFTDVWWSRFCSRLCGQRFKRRLHGSHRKRARHYGVPYEPIDARGVFMDNGYRCGICGEQVDAEAEVPALEAPTLDHILPMAQGGPHLRWNVQCAHFICNSRKRDEVEAVQLRMAA